MRARHSLALELKLFLDLFNHLGVCLAGSHGHSGNLSVCDKNRLWAVKRQVVQGLVERLQMSASGGLQKPQR